MKIQGIIEAKKLGKSGEGEYGPWQVYEFTINGKRYSCFKKELYEGVKVGDSVEIQGETTEKGFNMKSMKLLDSKPEVVKVVDKPIKNGNGSMYASYAKDVFVAIHKDINQSGQLAEDMDIAIKLVKQAKEAFE